MSHRIVIDGQTVDVATSHETYLADGVELVDIPNRSLLALIAMGKIDKEDAEVKLRIEAIGKEAVEAAESAPPCLTCAQKAAKRAAEKKAAKEAAEATKAPAPEAPAPEAKSEPEKPKATRKPRAKKA